jgi:hypothetical protein
VGTVVNHDDKAGKLEVRTDKEMRTITKTSPDYALVEPCGSHIGTYSFQMMCQVVTCCVLSR